jgi:hypothetical protein
VADGTTQQLEDSRGRTRRGQPSPLVARALPPKTSSIGQPGRHHGRIGGATERPPPLLDSGQL